jgi:hypothetical protein
MSGLLNVRGPIISGKPVLVTAVINGASRILSLKSTGTVLSLNFGTFEEIFNVPVILNGQNLGLRQDFMSFTLVYTDQQFYLTYAGNYSSSITNLNVDLITMLLVSNVSSFKYFAHRANIYDDLIYASQSYEIVGQTEAVSLPLLRFLPALKEDYFIWNGNSVVSGTRFYPDFNVISFFRTPPTVEDELIPQGKCLTLQPGSLGFSDSACLFTTAVEAGRKYWYNYCTDTQSCSDQCFGRCPSDEDQEGRCKYSVAIGGRAGISCYTIVPPPFEPGDKDNGLPWWIYLTISILVVIIIIIIIVAIVRRS